MSYAYDSLGLRVFCVCKFTGKERDSVPTVGDMHFGEHNVVQSPYAHLKESQQ